MSEQLNPVDLQEFDTEVERYELRELQRFHFEPDRRGFAQAVGAGLVFAFASSSANRVRGQRGRTARREEPLSQRFHVGDDGSITVFTSKVEVGQGSRTQLTQAAAEELRMPVDHVRLVMADTERCPDDGGTAGSRTTPSTVPRVRNAAAALREILLQQAARALDVPPENVQFRDGSFQAGSAKHLTLAELASDPRFTEWLAQPPLSDEQSVTPVAEWQVLGQSIAKTTGRSVVTGSLQYPSDTQRPDMQYGKVVRPVSYGARLLAVDLSAAEAMPGVTVVRDGEFIGCVAATSHLATKACRAISETAEWERPEHPSSEELFDHLKATAQRRGSREAPVELPANTKRLDASYTVAYIQHAPMEPRAAVAEWQDGQLTVWTGSQQPARVHGELCTAFRLSPQQVRVIVPDTGGGFGGKHTGEAAVEAARLAKSARRPVSLRWTREEEFTWAYFRPAGLIEVTAAVDAAGRLSHWHFTNYNSGGSAIETPYRVREPVTQFVPTDSPLRQGSYRALASTANTFARESAMDELAELAASDPLAFRLEHLDDGRLKDVLLAATDAFGWRDAWSQPTAGQGVGLACGTEKGSFVAACAEVEVRDEQIHVLRVCQAYECGAIQNPDNLRAQVTGAIIQGLGGALSEAMQFESGQIRNDNFSSYRVPRMRDVPEIDIVLLDRRDLPSVGGSETPIIAIAPAIAGAIYRAVGQRLRSMPIRLSI